MMQRGGWGGDTLVALVVLLFGARGNSPAQGQPRRSFELELAEIESVRLPAGLGVLGGVLADDGSVFLWSADAVWHRTPSGGALSEVCRGRIRAPRQATYSRTRGRLEVFDSASARVVSIVPGTVCRLEQVWAIKDPGGLVVRTSSTWIELSPRGPTALSIRRNRPPFDTTLHVPDTLPLRFGRASDYLASSAAGSVLLTESTFPFRTFRVAEREAPTVLLDPASQLPAVSKATLLSGWRSLRPIAVDQTRVQVLADAGSDLRLMLVLDEKGSVTRARQLDVAIGILDASPATRVLIAVRNVGERELVYYRWRWRAGS